MKYLFLSIVLPCVMAEICLKLLQNKVETSIIRRRPGYVWRWNTITEEFEQLEALKLNNSAFCSVNAVNDLHGKTLVVAIDFINPYIIVNANKNSVTGLIGDTWKILETVLNFKTIYRRVRRSPIATLMNGDTHALLIATTMYSYTSSYYTYSVPLTTNSYALFVQSEGTIVTKWWYINIFSYGLWLASFVSVICIACSIMGIYRVKKLIYINYKDCDDELSSPSFNFLYALSGMSGQGFQKIPRSLSLRLIILSCLVMGMLLSCGFSSTLTSCLASKGNSVSLANLEDVATKRTHSLCVRNDSSAYLYFTVDGSADGDLRADWKGLMNYDCPDMGDSATLVSKLCRPGFVYLEVPAIFLPIYRKVEHDCDIVQLPDTYWRLKVAFLHARTAQYRHLIDAYLMRMRSAGIFRYLEKKWISEETHTPSNYLPSNSFQPVEYVHVGLTIWLLIMMMIISVFICILENAWCKLPWKYKKKNSNSILLRTHDKKPKVMKSCHKARPSLKWRRKFDLISLSGNAKNPEFLQSATIRINRW